MKKVSVTIKPAAQTSYDIVVGKNILQEISSHFDFSKYTRTVIVTDEHANHWQPVLSENLPLDHTTLILPPGEIEKNIDSLQKIWHHLKETKCDRKSLVINLGGGVIGDMGGFAASTYMRGIDFINIPTTLLSQVDASVGGKTSIDFEGLKNFIGTFTQPKAVIIDVKTLTTLPERQLVAGFAEVIKHGLIADERYFKFVTSKKPSEFSSDELIEIISGSNEIKKHIVEEDTLEKGLRKLVNFGHTIGHAIESLRLETDHPLLHGEAVSLGIVAEARLSQLKAMISEDDLKLIKEKLNQAGLPTHVERQSLEKVLEKMSQDKKNTGGEIKWTLLARIGKAVFDQSATAEQIEKALEGLYNK